MNKIIKQSNLKYHEDTGNCNRRVRYGNKENFDILKIQFTYKEKVRCFTIASVDLPEKDSIHLKFEPSTESISWSPKYINEKITELTSNL